jgi:acetolactate synthase-1/2/3 large subunit
VKVADKVAEWLSGKVKHVFTVSGGADLHLIHAIWRRDDIEIICPQNEQAASFAADSYSRLNGFGCALATSGPGATNLITGIASSFYDSIPVLYLTGNQTKERMQTWGTRQYGFQSTPITAIVREITKYAVTITHPSEVIMHLEAAFKIANGMRPGPVLIDLPDDIQRSEI